MNKIIILLLISSFNVIAGGYQVFETEAENSTNATATEYIILLCSIPDGSIIDSKQANNEGEEITYTRECNAIASLEGTQGQVIKSHFNHQTF